jgi:class 3 adenylate cyclase/CheY-like chemotaxis protein
MEPPQTLPEYLNLQAKTSTFVSIDVVGSTTLKTGENEQDIIYTFLGYQKLVSQLTLVHQGEVIHIAGDGLMCRFAQPAQAARAAKAILEAMPPFNRRQNHLSRPIAIRVGVHTGEVLQTEAQSSGQIISQTLDLTAKLQQYAPTNTARFSEATVSQIKDLEFTLAKAGWDARLQMQVYEYRGSDASAAAQRRLPESVRVLIVEQELDDLIKLRKVLWSRQHDAMPVFSPYQATLAVQTWKPHLILLSVDLPWDAGWEMLRDFRLQDAMSSIPILVLSGQSTGQSIERAFNKGGNGFLGKPLDEKQILKRVEMALREFYL